MYAIEIEHPVRGWVRMQNRFRTKKCARGWVGFVRKAWHGLPGRIVEVEHEVFATIWGRWLIEK
jgi:hypothetical protein